MTFPTLLCNFHCNWAALEVSVYSHILPGATTFSDTGPPSVGRCARSRSGLSVFCLAERSSQGRWTYSHNFLNISPPKQCALLGYHWSLCKSSEERSCCLLLGGSLNSRISPPSLVSVAEGVGSNDQASRRAVPELISDRPVLGFPFSTPLCSTLLFISVAYSVLVTSVAISNWCFYTKYCSSSTVLLLSAILIDPLATS
jgi:hypothetical protein